ncbi:MAG: OmpA family protein [Gemmatimonadales bacterium]
MPGASRSFVLAALTGLTLGGCAKKDAPGVTQGDTAAANPLSQPSASATAISSGFDVNNVLVANPSLGTFPYVGLIDGYQPSKTGESKDVAFDKYEFFDGSKINTIEGHLTTIEAEGQGASAYQAFKTYETLITGLGGVKVFEGTAEKMDAVGAKFSEPRHRDPVYSGDQMGVYLLRTPAKDIWAEAYIRQHGKDGTYFLTVVEKKPLEIKASLLPAEEMKKELDAKGHVALYINFDFDKADIKPESQPIIGQIVKLLKNNPSLYLAVEGHTDDAGRPAYNRRLSNDRAKSVVAALTAQGIEAGRVAAFGYGPDRPIADNGTDEGRARNRRVELVKVQ